MNRRAIVFVLLLAGVCLAICLFGAFWVSDLANGSDEVERIPPALQTVLTIAVYGISASTLVLWINEMVLRWREGVAEGDWLSERLIAIGWVLVLNMFGAYFFAFRRIRKTGEDLDPAAPDNAARHPS